MAKGAARRKGSPDEAKFRRLIVRLTPELDQALKARAESEDRPLAWLVRKALAEYLHGSHGARLRRPCEHIDAAHPDGHYEPHLISLLFSAEGVPDRTDCPGGEFLADDALVVEKVNGEWPEWAIDGLSDATSNEVWVYADFLDALTVRKGAE